MVNSSMQSSQSPSTSWHTVVHVEGRVARAAQSEDLDMENLIDHVGCDESFNISAFLSDMIISRTK